MGKIDLTLVLMSLTIMFERKTLTILSNKYIIRTGKYFERKIQNVTGAYNQ